MSDDFLRMEKQYDKYDTERASGLLFLLFIWLVGVNPMLTALLNFPVTAFYARYLPKIGHEWIKTPVLILNICTAIFILSGFILGIKIHKLKLTAWKIIKWYFPVIQIFFLLIIIPSFFVLPKLNSVEILPHPEYEIKSITENYIFRISISTAISLLWFLYCIKSKKAPKQFSDLNKK